MDGMVFPAASARSSASVVMASRQSPSILNQDLIRSGVSACVNSSAWRPQLWLGVNSRGPLTPAGIYQIIARRGRQCGATAYPHRFRHHFSHTWLDRGGAERDLMELNGWTSRQMLTRYGASARGARARRSYNRIMDDTT